MRYRLLLAACLSVTLSASASAHTSVGGGGAPDDPNADCLRWEVVPLTTDSGVADAAAGDAGRTDAGSSGLTVLRCAEHATMFGCACALGRPPSARDRAATALAAAALIALAAGRRRARRRDGRQHQRKIGR
jgi:hypothetical protein